MISIKSLIYQNNFLLYFFHKFTVIFVFRDFVDIVMFKKKSKIFHNIFMFQKNYKNIPTILCLQIVLRIIWFSLAESYHKFSVIQLIIKWSQILALFFCYNSNFFPKITIISGYYLIFFDQKITKKRRKKSEM